MFHNIGAIYSLFLDQCTNEIANSLRVECLVFIVLDQHMNEIANSLRVECLMFITYVIPKFGRSDKRRSIGAVDLDTTGNLHLTGTYNPRRAPVNDTGER